MLSAKKIAAGKGGQIEARIKTENLFGAIEKRIVITTNDPRHSTVTLSIKANVEPEVGASEYSIFFGNVPVGKEAAKEIILTLPAEKPVRILSVVSKDPNVAVRLDPVQGSKGKKIRLTVTQKAGAKPSQHFGEITVKTDSRRTPEITIYERGFVSAAGK